MPANSTDNAKHILQKLSFLQYANPYKIPLKTDAVPTNSICIILEQIESFV
jgi:hypothetical protein